MAVDEERGAREKAGIHRGGLATVELDQHETLPVGTIAVGFGPNPVKERLLELEDFLDLHADDERLGGGMTGIGEDNIFEFVGAGRKDGSALVDLKRIEEIEDREMLNLEDLVHAFEAETALAIEKVGNMSLLEACLLGEAEAGEFACVDAGPEDLAEIVLQNFELHGRSIAPGY